MTLEIQWTTVITSLTVALVYYSAAANYPDPATYTYVED